MRTKWLAGVLGAGLLCAGAALADPRLDEKVYDPYVQSHVFEVETRAAGETGGSLGGARTYLVEGEYGLNDRLSLSLLGKFGNDPHEAARLQQVGLEAVYYLGRIPRTGVDVGGYLEYAQGLNGEENAVEAKLLAARPLGPLEAVANLIVERPLNVADERYASYGYAASLIWRAPRNLRLGGEAFGDLGTDHGFLHGAQGAYVGPMAGWEFRPGRSPIELEFSAAWLQSVGAARTEANGQFRLTLEIERRF